MVHLESVFPRTPRQRQGAHQLPLRTTCVADGSAWETWLMLCMTDRFFDPGIGARSAAGGMTALSLAGNVREHRFQMHHYRYCAGDPLMS